MDYAFLGRSGLKVSRVCLGTYNFGLHTDEAEAFRIMDTALDAGINFFDTANHYPDFVHCGRSESIIGRWFAQGGGRREKVVLATKVYQPMMDPADGPNNDGGMSKYKLHRHVEGSLRRLGTDYIELYQMHHVDHRTPWEEIWEGFQVLVYQGRIGYVGSSNFAGWHLAMAQGHARARNFMGLVSEQHRYSLLCRLPELEVLPAAKALGIGVLAYSPLGGGVLSGHALNPPKGSRVGDGAWVQHLRGPLEAFAALCRDIGRPEPDVALGWALSHPAMTSVVIGPRTVEQVTGALGCLTVKLDEAAVKRINEVFPGPGGSAPEAYAW
ncbi:MAG: aldo/keto reductase [Planctomycetota bacterium]|nr:aldo/keto reductase [Planctomycetota bacterium]